MGTASSLSVACGASATNPAVLVPTASIGRAPPGFSWTWTPGHMSAMSYLLVEELDDQRLLRNDPLDPELVFLPSGPNEQPHHVAIDRHLGEPEPAVVARP